MIVLACETSCDETAVAILRNERDLLANVLHSQVAIHKNYGGIVPELASRSHVEQIGSLVDRALDDAKLTLSDIHAVAATRGPGLLGALLIGMTTAQAIALARGLPFVGVNHLHGHLLSCDLEAPMRFPALVFLLTGGHTALYRMEHERDAVLLKRTADDAVGEAFDKVAKLLGLGYPGGPFVERMAQAGDAMAYDLPLPKPRDPRALSLSGLKTAVRRHIEAWEQPTPTRIANITAAFQAKVGELLAQTVDEALQQHVDIVAVYVVGGVAQNKVLKAALLAVTTKFNLPLYCPRPSLCTDNAAMIARAAIARLRAGEHDPLDQQPLARWEVGRWLT